jgi:hypothetical protein
MTAPPLLLVFAKAPTAGTVKTRLAATIGAHAAADVYRELVATTLAHAVAARARGIVADIELWCAPDPDTAYFRDVAGETVAARRRQCDGDLGERMADALADALTRHPRVLLAGTDCPLLDPPRIAEAADALAGHDAVLVPAEDGGYVLVGATRPLPFDGVRWSTPHALSDTLAGFARAHLRCALGATLWDVDDAAGLARWNALRQRASARPATPA